MSWSLVPRTVAILGLSLATALALVIGAREVFAATRVSPSSMNGWAFEMQGPDGSGTFVTGPATAPLGIGSVRLPLTLAIRRGPMF